MRRRCKPKKDIKFVEITQIGHSTWKVPSGCNKVEVFLVAGGQNGTYGDGYNNGAGGYGGETGTFIINTIPNELINVYVGNSGEYSQFKNESYRVNPGKGGKGGSSTRVYTEGEAGENGFFAFNGEYISIYPNRYGAGGGAGGADRGDSGKITKGGNGGETGGGQGGDSYGLGELTRGGAGHSATFYGSGGGGSGRSVGEYQSEAPGKGYQGIIIIKYEN